MKGVFAADATSSPRTERITSSTMPPPTTREVEEEEGEELVEPSADKEANLEAEDEAGAESGSDIGIIENYVFLLCAATVHRAISSIPNATTE
ncbi:MAG: hypothetical protein ACREBR_01705 [bacterium]